MIAKTVKVSDKGQIAIPVEAREEAGIRRGDELLLVQDGDRIILVRAARVARAMRGEIAGLVKLSE
jgi:AbrB family looped-hinge helix DNA binding protein